MLALQRSQHPSQTQQKSTLRLYDNWASPVSWDPSIVMLGSRVEIFQVTKRVIHLVWLYHACRVAGRMNQARNRTAGNTLFMRVTCNLYIQMAATGWPFSCNTWIKDTSAELARPAHVIRLLLRIVLLRSLHVKALEFAASVVRVWKNTT